MDRRDDPPRPPAVARQTPGGNFLLRFECREHYLGWQRELNRLVRERGARSVQ